MTASLMNLSFKKAVYVSLGAHIAFFLFIFFSPHLPKTSKKGFIQYIPLNMVGPGGGGGGGSSGPARIGTTPVGKRETLKDLTTPQKAKVESKSAMRFPADKPKKEPKAKTEKKAAITKPEPAAADKRAPTGAAEGVPEGTTTGGGFGTGLRIGTGSGPGGWGPGGPGLGGGMGDFPYTYYLNIITEKVSANWFTTPVDPGVSGNFQTVVYFKIQREGQIVELKVEQSSGITSLDLSAMRAIRAAAPFPPLPRDYQEPFLVIHLMFEHAK